METLKKRSKRIYRSRRDGSFKFKTFSRLLRASTRISESKVASRNDLRRIDRLMAEREFIRPPRKEELAELVEKIQ